MKKILLLLAVCLSVSSCKLSGARSKGRTEDNLRYTATFLANAYAVTPAQVMDNCMLVLDFVNASEEERKSARFASIGYYASSNTFKIGSWGSIVSYGKNLLATGTEWTAEVSGVKYIITCIAAGQWEITGVCNSKDYGLNIMDFKSTFTFEGRDVDGLCTWQCVSRGSCEEDDKYSATFNSEDELIFKWVSVSQGGGAFSMSLVMSGTVTSTTFVDGVKTDWCTLTYENGDIKKIVSSL